MGTGSFSPATSNARRALAAAALLAFAVLLPNLAAAEGAIALGVPDDVAKNGLAFGRSWNVPDVADARSRALEECRNAKGAPQAARKLCKVVTTFSGQCAALALDNGAGTPGWGYGIGDTSAEAEAEAMRNCKRTAGRDRQKHCELGTTRCDETAGGGEERGGTERGGGEPEPSGGNDAQVNPSGRQRN